MAATSKLIDKIKKLVEQHKECAKMFNSLADELEETTKSANLNKLGSSIVSVVGAVAMIVEELKTIMPGESAQLKLAEAAAVLTSPSLFTIVGSEVIFAIKLYYARKEAKQIIEKLKKLEKEIQDLMNPLEPGAGEGEPSGSCDDDVDANVIDQLLRLEAKQQGLTLSQSVNLYTKCGLPEADIFGNKDLQAGSLESHLQEGGENMAESVGKMAKSKAAESVAGGAEELLSLFPKLVSNYRNLNDCETEASKTLRENAEAVRIAADEMGVELRKIRDVFQKLVQIKSIIKKENRSSEEKKELIQYMIENTEDKVTRQWLIENQESDVFFKLLDLCNFIQEKLDEEKEKKAKREIDLIFVAHGKITEEMIPARCLWSLPSITDVILYSPWNSVLNTEAAYGIATGCIEPRHRRFICEDPEKCPLPDADHKPSLLQDNWNSMKDSNENNVPEILVSPIVTPNDTVFPAFLSLEEMFGEPGADRYVIPYTDIGTVPFRIIMLILSKVLDSSKYEARVHLAACLGKISEDTIMNETYLMDQYYYTMDHTLMGVTSDMIYERNNQLLNIMSAVFGPH